MLRQSHPMPPSPWLTSEHSILRSVAARKENAGNLDPAIWLCGEHHAFDWGSDGVGRTRWHSIGCTNHVGWNNFAASPVATPAVQNEGMPAAMHCWKQTYSHKGSDY